MHPLQARKQILWEKYGIIHYKVFYIPHENIANKCTRAKKKEREGKESY